MVEKDTQHDIFMQAKSSWDRTPALWLWGVLLFYQHTDHYWLILHHQKHFLSSSLIPLSSHKRCKRGKRMQSRDLVPIIQTFRYEPEDLVQDLWVRQRLNIWSTFRVVELFPRGASVYFSRPDINRAALMINVTVTPERLCSTYWGGNQDKKQLILMMKTPCGASLSASSESTQQVLNSV